MVVTALSLESLMAWLSKIRIAHYLALALLTAAVVVQVLSPPRLETLRSKVFDWYQVLSPRQVGQHSVKIIDIDEKSLGEIGQWPWPRTVIAQILQNVSAGGAIVIGLDMAFPEPDRLSPGEFAKSPGAAQLPVAIRKQLAGLPSNEVALANVMARSRVVLGIMASPGEIPDGVSKAKPSTAIATIGGDPRNWVPRYPGIIGNVSLITKFAKGQGLLSLYPEGDGVVRRVPLIGVSGNDLFATLGVEMLRAAMGQSTIAIKQNAAGLSQVIIGNVGIPTDAHGQIWVRYRLPDKSRYYSAADVLAQRTPPNAFKNQFVLMGASASGLFDIKETPVAEAMPGVEVHANVLETMLSGAYLIRPNYINSVEIFVMIVAALMAIFLVPRLGIGWTFAIIFILAGGLAAVSGYLFVQEKILLDVTQPAAVVFAVYLVMAGDNYLREANDKRRIRVAFSHYLAPAMVERLVSEPGRLRLGGETKNLSIVFCDVRGFTAISETFKDDPQGLTVLINRLLTPLTEVILKTNGTIDKYMGDCIMAFWNAPMDELDHTRLSCRAALGMLQAMVELNVELEAEAAEDGIEFKRMDVGIGINTDDVVVGNMGSLQRFDYSILGDGVNLAARLEGQSKTYDVKIVIGENTKVMAPEFAFLELDMIAVKGKSEAVRIFTLLGLEEMLESEEFTILEERHIAMLAAYRGQRWKEARDCAQSCAELWPDLEGLYDMFKERITEFELSPPAADWDGVFVATSK